MREKNSVLIIVVVIVLITIFVGIGILIISTPTVKGLSQCLDDGNKDLTQATQRGIVEKWNEREACFQFKQSTERLLSCYESVERKSLLPISVPFTIVTLFKKSHENMSPQGLIKLHNSECGQYPESKILE